MDWILSVAKEYGLFVALVVYVLWDSRQRENRYIIREQKYIGIIESIKGIRKELQEIRNEISK